MGVRRFDPRYDGEPEDPRDLSSRSDARRERKRAEAALFEMAERLVKLSDRVLERLELPEEVLETLADTRRIKSPAARNRSLRALRIALRGCDPALIRKVERALEGHR